MKNKYWEEFWVDYGERSTDADAQTQVLRTLKKKPIDNRLWEMTLEFILEKMEVQPSDNIIDLCCGNGLISKKLAPMCKSITAVDISSHLLDQIDTDENQNIAKINQSILELDLPAQKFEKVILYAGIQYFDTQETVKIFNKVYDMMKPGGIFLIGDIPDQKNIWLFFDNFERESAYFDSIKNGKPIVGQWFLSDFLVKLGRYAGFSHSEVLKQSSEMIYSFFRFDMRFMR